MTLTPLDADNVRFRGALSGYSRGEVDQFRARVVGALEDYLALIESLRARITALEGELLRYRESEELLKSSVVLAQRTADELIGAAHQRSDAIVRTAELDAEGVRRSMAQLHAEREEFEYAFHGLLTGFLKRLEQGNPALSPRATAKPALGPEQASAAPTLAEMLPAKLASGATPPRTPTTPGYDADATEFARTIETAAQPPAQSHEPPA